MPEDNDIDYSFDETGHVREQSERPSADDVAANENREAAIEAVRRAKAEASGKAKKLSKADDDEAEPKRRKPAEDESEDYELASTRKHKASKSHAEPEEEPEDAEDESDEESPAEPKAKPVKHDEEDDDEVTLRKVLKNRAKIAKEKAAHNQELERQRNELNQQKAQLEYQHQQLQEGLKRLERLKSNPAEAIRENGWDPESFILDIAQSDTPEGRQAAQLRHIQAQLQAQEDFNRQLIQANQRAQAEQQQRQAQDFRRSMEDQFLGTAMDTKKSPLLSKFYKGNQASLIFQGDLVAIQYRELTGKEASPQQIAEYLEEQLAESLEDWYSERVKSEERKRKEAELDDYDDEEEVAKPTPPSGAKRKTGKTLSSNDSGERRLLKKDLSDLDDDELREVARQNVKLAVSKHRSPRN